MTAEELLPDPDTDTEPDPDEVADLAEFIAALGQLRLKAGAPSYRALAKRVGPLLRPPQEVSASTVHDVFSSRRRRLDFDLVAAVVGALGLGAAEVERWRVACVRVHAEAKVGGPVGVFRQLPADLATFTGRELEVRRLLAAAGDGGSARTVVISAIEGMAGVGKTQLAVHVAHELVRSGRGAEVQLYVNLRGFDPEHAPSDPSTVLEGFLRRLGVAGTGIPEGLDERSAMFRDRLHGREALIVLDNAADEAQVRDLIPAGAGTTVLITSRRSLAGLDGASLVLLDPFELSEGMDLLVKIVGERRVRAEPGAAREIVELCGGLPLAVALAASRLRSKPSWTVADLARRLRSNMVAGLGDGSRSPWPVFELSYVGLPEAAQRLFRLLAAHPGQDVTAESVAALAGVDVARAQEGLELLVDEHLLQAHQSGRYELHDLLRVYAQEKLTLDEPPDLRAEALGRVLSWYTVNLDAAARAKYPHIYMQEIPAAVSRGIKAGIADVAEASAWCEVELPNLSAAAWASYESGDEDLCSRLSTTLSRLLTVEGQLQDAAKMARIGLKVAESAGDVAGQALAHHRHAGSIAAAMHGNRSEALEHLMAALSLFRSIGDVTGELETYVTIIGIGAQEPEADFDMAQEALAIARRLGNKAAEANILFNLAGTLNRLQRPADALEYVLQSLAIVRASGGRYAIAVNALGAGFTSLLLEDYVNAEAYYGEAAALFREIGDHYRHIECLHGQARAIFGQGRADEARRTVAEAEKVLESFDETRASQLRQRLESSPSRYSESGGIDPGGRAGAV